MWVIEEHDIVDYQQAYEQQQQLVKQKQEGDNNNYFLLMQHDAVFTKGKSAKSTNILDKTIPVYGIDRGGDLTFHEPGQLVGYIITDLRKQKLNIRSFVTKIENIIIDTLAEFQIKAHRNPDIVGVWVNDKKIASIGIAIKKGVTMHGFALNVNNEMAGFNKINPCGLSSSVMTSVKQLIGHEIPLKTMHQVLISQFLHSFDQN